MRLLIFALGLCSLCLIAMALIQRPTDEKAVVRVEPVAHPSAPLAAGSTKEYAFRVENASPFDINILGGSDACTSCGCGHFVGPFPINVPASGSAVLTVAFSAYQTGRFDFQVPFFIDAPDVQLRLRLSGEVR